MLLKLAFCFVAGVTYNQTATVATAADIINPFFITSNQPSRENICNVFSRSSVNKLCKPGNPLYFGIDRAPADAFPVKNDSGLIIADLHLKILDPGKYQIEFNDDATRPRIIGTLNKAPVVNAGCAGMFYPSGNVKVGCFDQPDAAWDTGASNIFDKITRSNNNRTVAFTDPKTRNGVMGIDKDEIFIDGKVLPPSLLPPNRPPNIFVESSFSVAPAKAKSEGKSVSYDAINSILSFSNDLITDTGDPADPVIGSEVLPPSFRKIGISGSNVNFVATSPTFTIHNGSTTYFTGEIDALTYSIPDNKFFGTVVPISIAGVAPDSPFFNSALPDITSAFLAGIDEYLNPNSTIFDPNSRLFYTVQPDADFFALTNGFSTSNESSVTNLIFIASVPEPTPTLSLLALGTLGAASTLKRKLKPSKLSEKLPFEFESNLRFVPLLNLLPENQDQLIPNKPLQE